MMRRGIIIKGLRRGERIEDVLGYADSLLRIDKYCEINNKRSVDLYLLFIKDDGELFNIAHKLRSSTKVNVEVKYFDVPHLKEPKKNHENKSMNNRKDFGNPFLKPTQKSFIQSASPDFKPKIPKLRIDLKLNDVYGLFDYLKSHPINTQTKERYKEPYNILNSSEGVKDNASHRATFVADNINIDKRKVEIYVNGVLSSDVGCYIEEKTDAYILHLYYKGEREYAKAINISKEESQEPIVRFNYSDDENLISVNGKKLSVTFKGYDAYKASVRGHTHSEKEYQNISTKYIGDPNRERKTAITQQTKVETDENMVHVVIDETLTDTKNKKEISHNIVSKKETPKMGWLARLMLHFWTWYYKRKKK